MLFALSMLSCGYGCKKIKAIITSDPMMSSPSFARRVGGWDVNTLSEGSMQIRYTSMFLLRYYEEIPNFLSGNRNFFFIYYEEIHRIGYKPVQRALFVTEKSDMA